MDDFLVVWKTVFSKKRYIFLSLLVFVLFYSLNVLIANFSTLLSFALSRPLFSTIALFIGVSLGFPSTILPSSFISLIIIGLLLGIIVSLLTFKIKNLTSKSKSAGVLSTLGIVLGILAPGCAACGLGLAASLGLSSFLLSILPFKGLELSILSIILLVIAIYQLTKSLLVCQLCQITLKAERRTHGRRNNNN